MISLYPSGRAGGAEGGRMRGRKATLTDVVWKGDGGGGQGDRGTGNRAKTDKQTDRQVDTSTY
jgi:hypothetical protein